MPNPYVGLWSNGERIDLAGVPLVCDSEAHAVELVQPYEAANGGSFDAIYRYTSRRSDGRWVYALARVLESMPPRPPQIQGFDDERRLPMMEGGGFSARLEAQQRRKEWAEA